MLTMILFKDDDDDALMIEQKKKYKVCPFQSVTFIIDFLYVAYNYNCHGITVYKSCPPSTFNELFDMVYNFILFLFHLLLQHTYTHLFPFAFCKQDAMDWNCSGQEKINYKRFIEKLMRLFVRDVDDDDDDDVDDDESNEF